MNRFAFLLIILFVACKKDPDNLGKPATSCLLDDEPKEVLVPFSGVIGMDVDPRDIDLKLWSDGWVALFLKGRDSVYICNANLELQTRIYVPGAQGIQCLTNQRLLTVSNQSTVLVSDTQGNVDAWQEVGRDNNCERVYVYVDKAMHGYQTMEAYAELHCYNRQGSSIYSRQLTGYASDEDPAEALTELNGKLYIALANQDTIRTSPVLEGGIFQDSLVNNSEDVELLLYQIDDQGAIVSQKEVTTMLTYFPRVVGKLVGKGGNLWYSSQYEIMKISSNGALSARSFNPKEHCAEQVREFLPHKDGVMIRSTIFNGPGGYWYTLNGSLNPVDFPASAEGIIVGLDGDDVYVYKDDKLINAANANIIWELSPDYLAVEPYSLQAGCNGKLYGIAYKGEVGNFQSYIIKAN